MSVPEVKNNPAVFDALRVKRMPAGKSVLRGNFYFQLALFNESFYLRTVDAKGITLDLDHRGLRGQERNLVKAIEGARMTSGWSIEWEADEEGAIPLDAHGNLMQILSGCSNVVDQQMRAVTFDPGLYGLELQFDASTETTFEGSLTLVSENNKHKERVSGRFVTPDYFLAGQVLYRVHPIGPAYRSLSLFVENFSRDQMDECLTLFFSTFSNTPVRYADYRIVRDASILAEPAIVFREVDSHSALYLEIMHYVPGLSLEFLRDYDVTRRASLDDMERCIRIADIEYHQLIEAEQKLVNLMKKLSRSNKSEHAFWMRADDGQFILGAELAKNLLKDSLAELAVGFRLYGVDKLAVYKIRASKPRLHLNLSSGINFLEGSAELEVEGERFALQHLLQQYRKHKFVELSDGTQAVLNQDYVNKLQRLFKKKAGGVRVSVFDLPLIDELIDENARETLFPKSRKIFEGFNSIKNRRVASPLLRGELRPYQKNGLKWLDYLHEHQLGGCLADDMGLGKTIQVIALLLRIYPREKKPTLILMPKSLLLNWRNELERFAPDLSFCIHYGTERDMEQTTGTSLILTTYGTLRNDVALFADTRFHAVILDESQAIKNHQAQITQAVLALKADFRLAMSGTPIENNLGELYSLFSFLNPAMFSTLGEFERDYLNPIQRQADKDAAAELRKKVYPFILRRLKTDVLKDLPPKVEQVLYVEMSEDQRRFYEMRRQHYQSLIRGEIQASGVAKSQFLMLEAMLELRQIATVPEVKTDGAVVSAKWEALEEVLAEATAGGSKCLIFTNFLACVEEVSGLLTKNGIEHLLMTGATSNRQDLVDRFQNDAKVKAMVMTLKTGGVGLNLTAADTVFIVDPWWNTSAEAQAVDRTHRIGQQSTVFTYRLIAKDSIEEKIRLLQLQKKELTDQIISSDGAALKSLDAQDIEFLLGA